jgi:hypothetical protein
MKPTRSTRSNFGAGGVYACRCCAHNTRSTGRGDNENAQLCAVCYDLSGESNSISDTGELYGSVGSVRADLDKLAARVGADRARSLFPDVAAHLDAAA